MAIAILDGRFNKILNEVAKGSFGGQSVKNLCRMPNPLAGGHASIAQKPVFWPLLSPENEKRKSEKEMIRPKEGSLLI